MKVVLREDVDTLGLRGEVVDVARGYARNFLLPRKLAEPATPARVKELEKVNSRRALSEAQSFEQAQEIAQRLGQAELRFDVKAGETGVLFGSVTQTNLADLIWDKLKVRVDRRKIGMDEPLKRIGRHHVPIELFADVTVETRVLVVPEGGELPPEEELQAIEDAEAAEAAAAEALAEEEHAAAEAAIEEEIAADEVVEEPEAETDVQAEAEHEPAPAPPQNLDAEESVLGAMMLSPGAIGAVSEVLDAGDFYRESHAKIYRATLSLYARGEPVDAITLVDELEERGDLEGAGGRERIHELAALVPATANAAHYARIVREMATLRGLIRVGGEVARLGWERPGDAQELVDQAVQVVFELSQSRVASEFSHIEELLKESFERITQLYEAGEDLTGVPSGYRDIDRITGGFQPGNLIIVAARPSMGKSALGLGMAANLGVRSKTPVALFTLEMSKSEVTQRLMCSEAKVESNRLRTGKLAVDDWPRLTAACDKLAKAPIYVDDTGSITMMEIRAKARRLKTQEPTLGLIIVDYLQLMTTGASVENRVQEVSQISRQLKVLARDLDTPVLAMSQLSRAVEQRHDKRPILSDLRESGAIEQDADLVFFIYRDEYYNEETDQQGLAEVICAKHRNGPTGSEKLSFLKRYAKFADLAA